MSEIQDREQLIGAIEALIFVAGDPLPLKRLQDVLDMPKDEICSAIDDLSARYLETGAGIQVMEVAGGYQLRTRPTHSVFINRFLERKRKSVLSGPAMETVAIVAYKQPLTRAEIEAIRGVGVDGVLKSLLDKRLIKVVGAKEVPGRPNLYGTTKKFLEYFGINSLDDLPPVEQLSDTFSSVSAMEGEETSSETGQAPAESGDSQKSQVDESENEDASPADPDPVETQVENDSTQEETTSPDSDRPA